MCNNLVFHKYSRMFCDKTISKMDISASGTIRTFLSPNRKTKCVQQTYRHKMTIFKWNKNDIYMIRLWHYIFPFTSFSIKVMLFSLVHCSLIKEFVFHSFSSLQRKQVPKGFRCTEMYVARITLQPYTKRIYFWMRTIVFMVTVIRTQVDNKC